MTNPLVSVVIPAYKRPELLQLTLHAVTTQSYTNMEVLVIDDGTPNNDIQKVCEAYPKVTYYKIENSGGPAKPRNVGISKSKGDYIAFVDDDDLWHPKKLETQVNILLENPDFGLCHNPCSLIGAQGEDLHKIIGKPKNRKDKHGDVSLKMMGNWTLMTSTVLVKREVLDQVGGFNETMPPAGEDTEFWCRCSFYTSFYFLPDCLVKYRRHSENSLRNQGAYMLVPQYLYASLKKIQQKKKLPKAHYSQLKRQVVRMQIRNMRYGFWKNLPYIFRLNSSWFLNINNLKLFFISILKGKKRLASK